MSMSYSERMRYIQEEANKYVARNKCRDSSEITLMRQAKASSVAAPQTVQAVINLHSSQQMTSYQGLPDCPDNVVFTGVGTSNTYSGILQKAQGCAICADPDPVTNPYITLPTPCFNRDGFPFVQNNVSSPYICQTIGKTGYFKEPNTCAASNNIYYTPSG
uniref:Uncharacterized protein n=1 Tax=viral metagenome TaxID=1070528 RepID=A0A6C0D971_9ZZZZ